MTGWMRAGLWDFIWRGSSHRAAWNNVGVGIGTNDGIAWDGMDGIARDGFSLHLRAPRESSSMEKSYCTSFSPRSIRYIWRGRGTAWTRDGVGA